MNNQSILADADAKLFLAVSKFQSTEETRYYLNGVLFEPGNGVYLVATDGHVLGAVSDPLGFVNSYFGEPDMICALSKEGLKQCKAPANEVGARRVRFMVRDGQTLAEIYISDNGSPGPVVFIDRDARLIPSSYPDWRRVWPKEVHHKGLNTFNPALIDRFYAAGKILKNGKIPSISLQPTEPGAPTVVIIRADTPLYGLLMPMVDNTSTILPDWISELPVDLAA